MIVNPGIRRFLGSAIQRLFNSASFYAPLTHSLVPERGTGSPTFTRASTATVMGYGPTDNAADGLKLLTVAANEARFVGARRISEGVWSNTFADGSLIPAATNTGYLAEGARTNLCLQSNAFTTTWAAAGTPAATQDAVGPDGGTTGWTLTDNDAAAAEFIQQGIVLTAAPHTYSVFVKKTSGVQGSYPIIVAFSGSTFALATIDTSNGVATNWTAINGNSIFTGTSARCSSYNDDYWRVELTYTALAANHQHYLMPAGTANPVQSTGIWDVTVTGSSVFYGAQLELGSFASTYIPTTTAAVTRAADVLTYPSAGNIDGTVGWCYAEVKPNAISASNQVIIGANGPNRTPAYQLAPTGSFGAFDGTNAPTFVASAFTANISAKVSSSWGTAGLQGAVSGTVSAATSFDGNYDFSDISVGINNSSTNSYFGTIRNLRIGQRQLSASEMQAITA